MIFGEGPIIKNIAGDLNKLFLQGSRVVQPITNVEGDAAADQGTSDLLAARDPVIQEVAVGMSGEQAVRYTVSGTPPLSLPNSLGKPLKAWAVDLLPYQEGTGDPSPDNVRPIHGTDKVNLFVEESYDTSATPKAAITLPATVYTATIGSDGGESRTAKRTFTGSAEERWAYSSAWSKDNTAVFYAQSQLTDAKFNDLNTTYITNCNSFLGGSRNEVYETDTPSIGYSGSIGISCYLTVRIYKTVASDLSEFITYLASNPLEIVYELATPTTFAVPSVTIPTPKGTATTWATAEDGIVTNFSATYLQGE